MSLPARVLVSKIFVFSTFVYVCNCTWITSDQVKLIQNILNNFVWNGRHKVQQATMYLSVLLGGLNMINIQNVLHSLHTKWMVRLQGHWAVLVMNYLE